MRSKHVVGCALALLLILFALAAPVHAAHGCRGDGCAVCAAIAALKWLCTFSVVRAAYACPRLKRTSLRRRPCPGPDTPIRQHIRLND